MKRKNFLDKINYIIWDWNGTIINDVQLCVDIINQLLKEYNLAQIGLKTYRNIFTFPVKKYYKKLGFDLDSINFEKIGNKFIELYNKRRNEIELQPGAKNLLTILQKRKKQILISARNYDSLVKDVQLFELKSYFDKIIGLNNDLAYGKWHIVKKFFEIEKIDPKLTLFIGDTVHDLEIAKKIGAHYLMVSNGHNSAWRLMTLTPFVYSNLISLSDFLLNA